MEFEYYTTIIPGIKPKNLNVELNDFTIINEEIIFKAFVIIQK